MAFAKTGTIIWQRGQLRSRSFEYKCLFCRHAQSSVRRFTTSPHWHKDANSRDDGPFGTRLRAALRRTKVEWKPVPVALGIACVGAVQFYRIREREKRRRAEEGVVAVYDQDEEVNGKPKKRKRIRPSGPWWAFQIQMVKDSGERGRR